MSCIIKYIKEDEEIEFTCENGTNLYEFMTDNDLNVDGTCGGKGTCGKCRVIVRSLSEGSIDMTDEEADFLGEEAIQKGYRLACLINVYDDIEIIADATIKKAKIYTGFKMHKYDFEPLVRKTYFELEKPSIEDNRDDFMRICDTVGIKSGIMPIKEIKKISNIFKRTDGKATAVYWKDELITVEDGDTSKKNYGVAIDIGTTTVAVYLINMSDGSIVDIASILNPQKFFGADVISRIKYISENEDGLWELQTRIIDAINSLISKLIESNNITHDSIYSASIVGNTTMMHIYQALNPVKIAVSPFIPVFTGLLRMNTEDSGLNINKNAVVINLPSVAAYVGADVLAGIYSTDISNNNKPIILVDIGTNGEMALGSSQKTYACSTAAGPAFEGANIRFGMGGVDGAIDKFEINPYKFSTISNTKALGICGSGIISAVSELLSVGVIEDTGRMIFDDEATDDMHSDIKDRITEFDGEAAFLIADAAKGESDENIYITQKDVREVQNAKAAICAGINVLLFEAGVDPADVEKVILAGGFGSYIDKDSALNIGLIPKVFKGKIETGGNTAGGGAVKTLKLASSLQEVIKLKENISYIELSSNKRFTDEYIEAMMFSEDVMT